MPRGGGWVGAVAACLQRLETGTLSHCGKIRPVPSSPRLVSISVAILVSLSLPGCATIQMRDQRLTPSCRTWVPADAPPIAWVSPFDADDRQRLHAWCEPLGPVVRYEAEGTPASGQRGLVLASWNIHVGGGSLRDLVAHLRSLGSPQPNLILLIQEAHRAGALPSECPADSGVAKRISPKERPDGGDIVQVAEALGMHAVYAPSMRNGDDCAEMPREDRGNAILSTLPLTKVAVIELPFAQQRRVAVAATISDGARSIQVMSLHLDTLLGHSRQAQGVWKAVGALGWSDAIPIMIGGDFNSPVRIDVGLRQMRKNFDELDCGKGRTHLSGFRLDHLFVKGFKKPELPECHTGPHEFRSDHKPLIIRFPSPAGE